MLGIRTQTFFKRQFLDPDRTTLNDTGVAPYFSAAAESPYPGMDIGTGGLEASFQRVAKGLTSLETRVFSLEQDAAGGGGRINVGAGVWMGDDGLQVAGKTQFLPLHLLQSLPSAFEPLNPKP
jgi:hypothetical protein